ncbi:hypothetical protein U9M48_042505 [Paspalum notatum var. saurae]|uniref:Integrase catalytic domain-containing protein n=1 Tax=Paspalum notatum var. saurae TaxID=547442 RepID=A0AAQ3XG78_PASNO
MHEELENFERNHVWDLVEPPPNRHPIGTKWVFKNKRGEDGMVVRNNARLASKLQQMDVKSAFPNGFIEEEVYVRQPPGFESARFPDRVYKLRKAFYGPKQAPRACFAEQMSREFEMSLMGELQFFLGLQIKQGLEGTFVHQAKYIRDILKKFNMGDFKPMTTPMSTNTALDADEDGEAVDQKEFRGMIGSLLYLTATRPDIQFAVCLCARYQASPRISHRQAVKRIFRLQVEGVDNALIKGEIESHGPASLLSWLSSMGLIRGLSKLKAEKDLVCHPFRHGKMVAASHTPVFQDLVMRLRNESHKAMRAIRSDNGGEFRNSQFENFCCDIGLEHQFSSPYTPPQNGVVERKNRTLVEMARMMLEEHRTPRRFWAKAVNTACYIANRILLRAFLRKTSSELQFSRQPSVKHLRAFDCDDEEGTPIFEDEEGADNVGDAGAIRILLAFVASKGFKLFAEQMSREFKISLTGELQFFPGLQIKQSPEETFVHQAKYTRDILKKFEMCDSKTVPTPMSTNTAFDADENGEAVDQKKFRGMIGSLLYLTVARPDIQFAVCLCARYQASPRTSHRQPVKRIFRYLKFTPELGLWYSSGSSLSLRGFSDADHAGCRIDRKSTFGTCQFLGTSLVSWSSRKQASVALSTTKAEYVAVAPSFYG